MPDDYAYYLFVTGLHDVRQRLSLIEADYRIRGNAPAADAVKAAYDAHVAGLIALSIEISTAGTEILRRHEHDSRVRPDTLGKGGARLGDNLVADPISAQGLPGSVGIANQDILEENVPWWSTNEEGSDKRVGGKVVGLFLQPGIADPDPVESRQHALFTPTTRGGLMTIQEPIPARKFVHTSIPEILALWEAGFATLKTTLVAEVQAAGRL